MTPETTSPPIPSPGQQSRFGAAYRVLSDAIAAGAFPGCAFGVMANGEVVLQDALGHFTYHQSAEPVTAYTIYDVASLTKVVATTAAAMLLSQRGLLDLDLPIGELLPGFIVGRPPGSYARYVKVRHMLAHNSGLPGYVDFFRSLTTPSALFGACLELPLQGMPGAHAEYSDPGFILLGKALEVITRESLPHWVRREVFHPLGLAATGFNPPQRARKTIPPTEEDTVLRHRLIQGEVQDENAYILGGAAGHAGLFSNVPDLLRFSQEILQAARQPSSEPRLYESATIRRFAERQAPEGSSRALGWDTPSENSSSGRHFSTRSIGHLGYSGCSLWIDLDAAIAIVLLTNRTWPDRQRELIREVRPAFHNAVAEALSGSSTG
jgi:CubicO group peptidase (beta-lactamase class C family)